MNKRPVGLEIFKAGTHIAADGKSYTFSEAAVEEIAASYNPDLAEAPLVVGHPKTDDPAYGWAQALTSVDGRLYAKPHQVDTQFAEMVNRGNFKKISASIYLPDTPGNPTPGKHYLRHIGFLGGQAPAVKGLRPAQFNETDGALEFAQPFARFASLGSYLVDLFQRMRDNLIDSDGIEQADRILPQWQIRAIGELTQEPDESAGRLSSAFAEPPHAKTPESDMSEQKTAEFAEREQKLAEQATQLEAREKAIKDREAAAQRADAVSFAEGLVQEGKLLPRHQAPVVELLLALPAGTALNFAEGDAQVKKPATDVLRELLTSMPKQVDFSEKSRGGVEDSQVANFAAPPGVQVDTSRAELYGKAKAYQAEHPNSSWADAVVAVGG